MKNLRDETIKCLNENGKTEDDVKWVGFVRDTTPEEKYKHKIFVKMKTTWEDFKMKADFEYNNGYGCVEIPMNLLIVGDDFWLERHEYDGAEGWDFKTMPQEPKLSGRIAGNEMGRYEW